MSVADIADTLRVRASTVSKMVDRLARSGLVVRSVDASDARRIIVDLTDAGSAVRERVVALHAALEVELFRGLGGDADAAIQAIGHLDDLVSARLRRLR